LLYLDLNANIFFVYIEYKTNLVESIYLYSFILNNKYLNFFEGLVLIWDCQNVTIDSILFLNNYGDENLIRVTNTIFNINSGKIQGIRTYSSFIITFLSSSSFLTNLKFSQFYPRLIYSSFGILNVSNCSFTTSFEKFGVFEICAIYIEYNNSFMISNSKFDSLSNNFYGSVNICLPLFFFLKIIKKAIYFNEISSLTNNSISDCVFHNNTSTNAGGAMYLFMPGYLTIIRCSFYNNNAQEGSGIYYAETNMKTLTLNSLSFFQNVAWENGAALFIDGSIEIIIENCNFTNNIIQQNSQNMGSVIFLNNPGNLSIISSIFKNNVGILGTCIYYSETNKKILFYHLIF